MWSCRVADHLRGLPAHQASYRVCLLSRMEFACRWGRNCIVPSSVTGCRSARDGMTLPDAGPCELCGAVRKRSAVAWSRGWMEGGGIGGRGGGLQGEKERIMGRAWVAERGVGVAK